MAKGKGEIKGWITRNGVHIPIYGHYSIRGGEEPKAKGAKWKRKKRLEPGTAEKNFKEGLKNHSKIQEMAEAHNDKVWNREGGARNGELYDEADKFADSQHFDRTKMRDAAFSAFNEKYVQTWKDKKAQEQGFADDASMRSYNEETGVNKETWKEKGKTIEVNGKKINVKPGENNSQAIYRTAMEEQGKPVDKEFYDSQRVDYNGNADDIVAKNKQVAKDEKEAKTIAAIAGLYQAEKQEQASLKTTPESYAQSKGKSIRDIAQEVNKNDAARAQANQLMKDGRTYDEAAALAHSDMERGTLKGQASSTPDFSKMKYSEAGAYVAAHKKDFGLNEDDDAYVAAYEIKKGTWKGTMPGQESTTPKVNKADAYNDKVFAKFKASGKTNQTITSDGYAGTMDDFRAAAKRAGVEIEYDKGYDEFYLKQPKQESTRASYKDANSRIANGEHTVDVKTDGSKRQINNAKKTIRKASNKAGENYGISEHKGTVTGSRLLEGGATFDTAVRNMSVSGLKQAYNTATGTERAQIRARLQALGYQFRGGRWTKK